MIKGAFIFAVGAASGLAVGAALGFALGVEISEDAKDKQGDTYNIHNAGNIPK